MFNSKFLLGVIVGAAAGALVTYLFATDEGKEILSRASDLEKELREDFKNLAKEDGD